jgi:hypothetical protein
MSLEYEMYYNTGAEKTKNGHKSENDDDDDVSCA